MKKVLLIGLMCVLSFVFSGSAFAGSCSNIGCTAPIKRIYVSRGDGGRILVELKDTTITANCTPYGGKYFALYKDHVMFGEMYSQVQVAAVSGKSAYLRVIEDSNVCEISYVQVNY